MAGNDKDMEKYLETLRKQKVEKAASKLSRKTNMTMEEARALLETKSQVQVKKARAERQLNALMEERKNVEPPKAILEESTPAEPEITEAVSKETIEESTVDPMMDRYRQALRETPSAKKQVFEQDLQNTNATMKDVQKLEMSLRNIQTSLTSLGGGGLGEPDVVRLIQQNSTNLSDSDLDYIASQIDDEFTDSAEVLILINDTVDSAFVNALVDASVSDALDSAEAIKLIGETVDSAYVNNLVDINTSLDSNDYQQIADRIDDEFTDSAEVLQLINSTVDSGYVNALVDAGLADAFDSAQVINVIHDTVDGPYITDRVGVPLDSADIQPMIDASLAGFDAYDSAKVLGQITTTVDSGYVNALVDINTSLDSADYDAIADRVSDDFLDSVEARALIVSTVDSAYIDARIDVNIDAFDSAGVTDLITNTVDSGYVDALGFAYSSEIQPKIDATFASAPHLIPSDSTKTLGSAAKPWKELFVDGASIHLGSLKLTDDAGSFKVVNDSSNDVVKINLEDNILNEMGDVTLDLANLDSDDFLVWDGTKWVNRELDLSGLEFQQTVDLTTDTAPASPTTGDLYINTTNGTADASWTGIAGQTVSELQAVVWSGSSSQWYLTTELGSGAVTSIGSSTASLRVDDTDASIPVLSIASASTDSAGLMSSAHYTKVESGLDSDIDALKTLLEGQGDSDTNALDSKIDGLDSDISALETRVDGHEVDIETLQGVDSAQNVRMDGIDSDKFDKSGGPITGPTTFKQAVYIDGDVTVTSPSTLKSNTMGSVGNSNLNIQRNTDTKIQITSSENRQFQKASYSADYGVDSDLDIPHKKYVDSAIDSAVAAIGVDSDLAVQVAENTDDITGLTVATTKNTVFNASLIEAGVMPTGYTSNHPISNAFQDIPNKRIIGWPGYGLVSLTNGGVNGLVASQQLNIVDIDTGVTTKRGILNPKRVEDGKSARYEYFTLSPPFKLGDDWIFTAGENPKDQPFYKLEPDNTFEPYGLNQAGYVDSSDNANALPKICRSWCILNHRVRLDPHIDSSGIDGGRYHLFVGNPVDRVDGNASQQAQAVLVLDVQDLIDGNEVETYTEGTETYSTLTKTVTSSRGGYPVVLTKPDGSPDIFLLQPGKKIGRIIINDLATKDVTISESSTEKLPVGYLVDHGGVKFKEMGHINGATVIANRYIVWHAMYKGIMCYDTQEDTLTTLVPLVHWVEWGPNRTKGDQSVPQLFGGTFFFPHSRTGYDGITDTHKGYRISDTLEVTEIHIPFTDYEFRSSELLGNGSDLIAFSDFDRKIYKYHILTDEWVEEIINGRVLGTFPLVRGVDVDRTYVPLVFNEQGLNQPADPWVPERFFKVSEGLNSEIVEESNFLYNDLIKEHDDFVRAASQELTNNAVSYNMAHTNRSAIVSNRDAIDDILFPKLKVASELEDTRITGLFEIAHLMAPEEDHPLYNLIDQNFVLYTRMYEGSKKAEEADGTLISNNSTLDSQRYGNDHLKNIMLLHIPTGKTQEVTTMYVWRPDNKGLPDETQVYNRAYPSPRGVTMIPREDGSLDCYLWIHNPLRTNHSGGLAQTPKDEACPLYRLHIPATKDIDNSAPFDNITRQWTNIRCPAAEFTTPAENPYGNYIDTSLKYQYEIQPQVFDLVDPETNLRHHFVMSYNKASKDYVTQRVFQLVFDPSDPDEGEIVPVRAHALSDNEVYAAGHPCKKKDIHDVERLFMFGSPVGLTELYFNDDFVAGTRVPELRNYADYIPEGTRKTHPTEVNAMGQPIIEERGIADNWYKGTTTAIQPLTLAPFDDTDELSNILIWFQSAYGICSLTVKNLGAGGAEARRTRLENNYQGTNLGAMHIENRMNIYNSYMQSGATMNLVRFQSKYADTRSFGSIWFFDYKDNYPFDTNGTNIIGNEVNLYNPTRVFDDDGNLVEQILYKRPIIEVRPNEHSGRLEIHCIPTGQKHHPSQVEDPHRSGFTAEGMVKLNDVFICSGAHASNSSVINPKVHMFNPKSRTIHQIDTKRVDMTSLVSSRQHSTVFGAPYGPIFESDGSGNDLGSPIHMISMLGVENSTQARSSRSQASMLRKVYELTGNESLIATDPDTWALDSAQPPVYDPIDLPADSDWDLSWQDSAGTFSDSASDSEGEYTIEYPDSA